MNLPRQYDPRTPHAFGKPLRVQYALAQACIYEKGDKYSRYFSFFLWQERRPDKYRYYMRYAVWWGPFDSIYDCLNQLGASDESVLIKLCSDHTTQILYHWESSQGVWTKLEDGEELVLRKRNARDEFEHA